MLHVGMLIVGSQDMVNVLQVSIASRYMWYPLFSPHRTGAGFEFLELARN